MRLLEISVTVQLYRYTHEIINTLSVSKLFSAVLAVIYCLGVFTICCIVILMKFDKLRNCVTAPFWLSKALIVPGHAVIFFYREQT